MTAIQQYEERTHVWSDIQDHLPLLRHESHGNVMEIGVRRGFSTSALLAGLEEHGGHLYSVDMDNCADIFKGHPQWTFIQADSICDVPRIRTYLPEHLDLLFVDGDHTFDGCLADLMNFGFMAKKILVHDCEALNYPGVKFACQKYARETLRSFKIISGSFGMGVIE